jgi:hypothetical protein
MGRAKYTAIGFVVSKAVLPYARRAVKRKAKAAAVNSGKRSVGSVAHNPGKSSLAVGAAAGAVVWLVKRRANRGSRLD